MPLVLVRFNSLLCLLSSALYVKSKSRRRTDQSKSTVVAAIASSIWSSYEKAGGEVNLVVVECEV